MSGDNYGIQHSGTGDIRNDGVQAFGPHATAIGADSSRNRIESLLTALRADLTEADLADDARTTALAHVDEVAKEVEAEHPKREKIKAAIAGLTAAAGTIGALVAKIDTLREAITQLLH